MSQGLNYVRLISKNLLNTCHVPKLSNRKFTTSASCFKTFEPDYLDVSLKKLYLSFFSFVLIKIMLFQSVKYRPDVYPPMNIQIKGYNFDVLESYQGYLHNMAESIGIDVDDA